MRSRALPLEAPVPARDSQEAVRRRPVGRLRAALAVAAVAASTAVAPAVPAGAAPRPQDDGPASDRAYVANTTARTVSFLDTDDRTVTHTVAVPSGAADVGSPGARTGPM
ncbi:hypothetical protein O1L60_05840 [Streptomyces diastatochromogenes]|nr:hypothetical protein [Streptomyces diastatochromogenes]